MSRRVFDEEIFEYFSSLKKAANFPAFKDLVKCTNYSDYCDNPFDNPFDDDPFDLWTELDFDTQTDFRFAENLCKKLLSVLIFGEKKKNKFIRSARLENIEAYFAATTQPLRVTMRVGPTKREGVEYRFFVKPADLKRALGMEVESLLSDNDLRFVYGHGSIIEGEIYGKPFGEIERDNQRKLFRNTEFMKAWLSFRQQTLTTLVGDMHEHNYAVSRMMRQDGCEVYKVRCIDFDGLFRHNSLEKYDVFFKR